MQTPSCPTCRVSMEEGFLIDRGESNSVGQQQWAEGEPQRKWYGIRVKGEKYPTTTYRCPRCGLLQSYARPKE